MDVLKINDDDDDDEILAKITKKTQALMGYIINPNFYRVPYVKFLRPAQRYK